MADEFRLRKVASRCDIDLVEWAAFERVVKAYVVLGLPVRITLDAGGRAHVDASGGSA